MPQSAKKAIFWDYDTDKMNFSNRKAKIWYLNRKLMFGDLTDLKKSELKKYLRDLSINPFLKELLVNFLKKYA